MKATRSKRKVNVAVVGLGFMGVTHIKAYQQLKAAKLVAVCDSVRLPVNGVLAGVAGNITGSGAINLGRDVKVYRALDEVLADPEVDLVDLCVPTPLHPEQSMAALKAGKHVLCEKPLALSSAQARRDRAGGGSGARLVHAGDVHAVLARLGLTETGGGREALRQRPGREVPPDVAQPPVGARPRMGRGISRAGPCSTCTSTTRTSCSSCLAGRRASLPPA